jgi:hypothetical protein
MKQFLLILCLCFIGTFAHEAQAGTNPVLSISIPTSSAVVQNNIVEVKCIPFNTGYYSGCVTTTNGHVSYIKICINHWFDSGQSCREWSDGGHFVTNGGGTITDIKLDSVDVGSDFDKALNDPNGGKDKFISYLNQLIKEQGGN